MKLLLRIIKTLLVNAVALLLISYVLPGFAITYTLQGIAAAAGVLTVLNVLLKPLLKLILSPVIILTLGLGLILVNGIVLFALDRISPHITLEDTRTLVYATLIISVFNIFAHAFVKSK